MFVSDRQMGGIKSGRGQVPSRILEALKPNPTTGPVEWMRRCSPPLFAAALTTPLYRLQLLPDPLDILTGSGIDLDDVAHFDEGRCQEFCIGLNLDRFGHVGGGISFDARFTEFNNEFDMVRRCDGDRVAVEQDQLTIHAILEIFPGIIDLLFAQFILLIVAVVHEHERAGLPIEELAIRFHDVCGFQRVSPFVGPLEGSTTDEVFEFALVQCIPLPGFDKVHFGHEIGLAVDLNLEPFAEFASFVRTHAEFPYITCLG